MTRCRNNPTVGTLCKECNKFGDYDTNLFVIDKILDGDINGCFPGQARASCKPVTVPANHTKCYNKNIDFNIKCKENVLNNDLGGYKEIITGSCCSDKQAMAVCDVNYISGKPLYELGIKSYPTECLPWGSDFNSACDKKYSSKERGKFIIGKIPRKDFITKQITDIDEDIVVGNCPVNYGVGNCVLDINK